MPRPRDVPPPRRGVRRRARQASTTSTSRAASRVCDTAAVYDRYPELFTQRGRRRARRAVRRGAVDDEKRRLAYLLAFTVDGFMGEQTKHLGDEIANTEGEATIEVDGETIGLRQAGVVQANEADRARRARIQAARLAATAEHLNPLLDTLWRRCHDLALELGYPRLHGALRRGQGPRLRLASAPRLEGFLADTDGPLRARHGPPGARAPRRHARGARTSPTCPTCGAPPASTTSSRPTRLVPVAAPHAGRHGHRPRRPDQRAPRHRGPRAQVAARLLLARCACPTRSTWSCCRTAARTTTAALLHEAGHTEHFAHVAPGPGLRVPAPRRQRRHRGLRLHLRPPAAQPALAGALSWTSPTATTSCASPASTTSTSCGATRPSWPTRPSCTRRRASLDGMAGRVQPPAQRGHHGRRAARRTTSPTSTTASTAPATCAPGCSRARCA